MLQALSDHDGGTSPVASEAALADALDRGLIHALIHDQGMVIYYADFSTHRGEPGLYIQDLYVTPDARGSGLARELVAATLRHQTWGARYITLGVSPANAAALRFYAKTGFTPRGYEMMILDADALKDLQ
jgi:ribosomal protein S18 acetylase RimI-like enzyme